MFELVTSKNGVQFLRSDFISCRHGFSTRIGGVSNQAHTASLNLAFGRGDADETVIENLRLFSEAMGIEAESVVRHTQIHSAIVSIADASMRGKGYFAHTDAEGDGFVTKDVDTALAVCTADCVPILMEDADSGVIGAVHAGWRGAAAGIAAECVRKMCALGAHTKNIRVAIGPAIHPCCYEVGEDFYDAVCGMLGKDTARLYVRAQGDRLHADIVGINLHFLLESGIADAHIDRSDFCTCCHPELFYSHRFSKGKRGTMLSVISL